MQNIVLFECQISLSGNTQLHIILSLNDFHVPAIICFLPCGQLWKEDFRRDVWQCEVEDSTSHCVCVGEWKSRVERRVLQSVIINLSGMLLPLLPDKLLHGCDSFTSSTSLRYPSITVSPPPTCTHRGRTIWENLPDYFFWEGREGLCLYFPTALVVVCFLLFLLPTWLFSVILSSQQTKKPQYVRMRLSFSSFAKACHGRKTNDWKLLSQSLAHKRKRKVNNLTSFFFFL